MDGTIQQVEVVNDLTIDTVSQVLEVLNENAVKVISISGESGFFFVDKTISYGDILICFLLVSLVCLQIFKIITDAIRR